MTNKKQLSKFEYIYKKLTKKALMNLSTYKLVRIINLLTKMVNREALINKDRDMIIKLIS
jgi:hypothetical protein